MSTSTTRVIPSDHPNLILTDFDRPGLILIGVLWADRATGEYEQYETKRDGSALYVDGSAKTTVRKGRLAFDWRKVMPELLPDWAKEM